jgi:hypothetical protein
MTKKEWRASQRRERIIQFLNNPMLWLTLMVFIFAAGLFAGLPE